MQGGEAFSGSLLSRKQYPTAVGTSALDIADWNASRTLVTATTSPPASAVAEKSLGL